MAGVPKARSHPWIINTVAASFRMAGALKTRSHPRIIKTAANILLDRE